MALNIKKKQKIVTEIRKIAKKALSAVVADYCGVSVNKLNLLRKTSREANVVVHVVRNTLMCRIVTNTQFECLKQSFIGPTLIAFSNENPSDAARLLRNFAKENINFKLKAASFEGNFIPASMIDNLANLPTAKEAIISLLLVMKETSVGKIVKILVALRNKKEKADQ